METPIFYYAFTEGMIAGGLYMLWLLCFYYKFKRNDEETPTQKAWGWATYGEKEEEVD